MEILLAFAFVSGLVTILAPCIWPLLPIILSASVMGNTPSHKRPLGITLGILISFGVLTLSISYLVSIFSFDPEILRYAAVIILLFLGVTMVLPVMTRIVESFVSRLASRASQTNSPSSGFWAGFVTGLSLGVVWTPCAGPILAAIATLAATRSVNIEIILVTIVYLIGVGIPLFVFSYAGQKLIMKSRLLNRYTGIIQRIFGVIMILTALAIATNFDKTLQTRLLDAFPGYAQFVIDLESNDGVQAELDRISGTENSEMLGGAFDPMGGDEEDILNANVAAPEIVGINNWLNSESLTLENLRGKVVLVDFWTYTCINCIRTLPHVISWYEKYKDKGFVVVGIHTPEFEFEKDTQNVEAAIEQYGIDYPVAQDNDYSTWRNYNNRYWPAKYLIDKDGRIRYYHFGEGEYETTERAIQLLLVEAGSDVSSELSAMPDETPTARNSPETYLGALRMEYYYPNGNVAPGAHTNLRVDKDIPVNTFTLDGSWAIMDEYSEAGLNAALEYRFSANKVFLVMRTNDGSTGSVRVFLDGEEVTDEVAGADVTRGVVEITEDRLYELIDLSGNRGEHLLRLEFSPGVQAFAFTFG